MGNARKVAAGFRTASSIKIVEIWTLFSLRKPGLTIKCSKDHSISEGAMKYTPDRNGMLLDDPCWEDLPIIQLREEFPDEDFSAHDLPPEPEDPPVEAARPKVHVPESVEATEEEKPVPVEDFLPLDG